MRLIQAKARCVEGVRDSGWFVPGREATVIYAPERGSVAHLFQALQAVNPPYALTDRKPFLSHPQSWRQGAYVRKVVPEKKTAVIMVFSAVPELVRELAEVDESLFETDRIEVGRRLDYSRWITFVELSASGRWIDVKEDFRLLRSLAEDAACQEQASFLDELRDTDRLRGELAEKCRNWLSRLHHRIATQDAGYLGRYRQCLDVVNLAQRMDHARRHVEQWLPPTIAVDCGQGGGMTDPLAADAVPNPVGELLHRLQVAHGGMAKEILAATIPLLHAEPVFAELAERPQLVVEHDRLRIDGLEAGSRLLLVQKHLYLLSLLSQMVYGRWPLLLIDLTESGLDRKAGVRLVAWLQQLGKSCQVIVGTDNEGVALEKGWQAVLQVGAGGLVHSGLKDT